MIFRHGDPAFLDPQKQNQKRTAPGRAGMPSQIGMLQHATVARRAPKDDPRSDPKDKETPRISDPVDLQVLNRYYNAISPTPL